MYTNSDATFYLCSRHEQKESYVRLYVEEVFWDDVKQSNVLKTGQRDMDSVLIVIPYESLVDPVCFATGKTLVVKGQCSQEIDSTDQKTIAESLQKLKENNHFVTVMTADGKLYGSEEMWHYELSCK